MASGSMDFSFHGPVHTSEEILNEVRSFVHGSHPIHGHKLTSEEHAKSAIFLLRTLPSARSAVLEHLCHVFDESVNSHVVELEGQGSLGPDLNNMIEDINMVLLGFVKSNSEAWAPLIFTWSIDLLGQISSKYAGRRGVPHSSSLNELLQLWMTCKATRCLMEISTQCIAMLISSCPDHCVDALLDTSVLHSPHFDWVVAHIGSCFPETIITRVLSCGLKDFCSHGNQSDSMSRSEKKVPKMASVVGILGHLASQHSKDIRKALLELFQVSLESNDEQQLSTVPFLLQLASMSPMLLKVITTDLVDCLTPDILNRLSCQFARSSTILQEADGLITLVVHLICKSGSGAFKLFQFVLETAAPNLEERDSQSYVVTLPHVQQCAALILDLLLLDLQRNVYSKSFGKTEVTEIPFLMELQRHSNDLCRFILTATNKRLYWIERLLSVIGVHCGESCASDILCYLLINASSQDKASQVKLFLNLQADFESCLPDVMQTAVQNSLYSLQHITDKQTLQLLNNFTLLIKWESSSSGTNTARTTLKSTLQKSVQILSSLLHHDCPIIAYQAVQLLYLVGLSHNIQANTLMNVLQSTVSYFFNLLHMPDSMTDQIVTTKNYLKSLSRSDPGQTMVIRFIIQGIMNKGNGFLFGGKLDANELTMKVPEPKVSLQKENEKHALSVTLPATASTVFHAGIIGQGLKPKVVNKIPPQPRLMQNIQSVLDVLYLCGCDDRCVDGEISESSATTMAELLVDSICPDVTHAGVIWPDEEFMKYTVERDLHIKRSFEDNPILMHILKIIAKAKPILCKCTVLVYGLLATLINYWEANREKKSSLSPKKLHISSELVHCMALADFLPPSLGLVCELFYMLTPYEVFLLLMNIWTFMKENPPAEDCYLTKDKYGRRSRVFEAVDAKYTKLLHSVLHHNIEMCGHFYSRIFPVSQT